MANGNQEEILSAASPALASTGRHDCASGSPSLIIQTAIQDVKLAAERLGNATGIPMQPSPMEFHNMAVRLREFARKADLLASLAIADAESNTSVEFTGETNFLHDQLDNENVFAALSKAADEAEEATGIRKSIFTGRRISERVW